MDFIPLSVEKFSFYFEHNTPVIVTDTGKAIQKLLQERDKDEGGLLKHLSLKFKAMQGIDMDFICRDNTDGTVSKLESLKLTGSSFEMKGITDLGLNIEHFHNLRVIDFTIDDEVSPNGCSEKVIQ